MIQIFGIFLRLGLTSFGGPTAHLAYLRDEFVVRRRWLSEHSYVDLVAFCRFLPGPTSSKVGMALGLARGGHAGSIAAWAGFTLPSVILLAALALGVPSIVELAGSGLLHGLKLSAVVVVAAALWSMGVRLCPDRRHVTIAILCACVVLLVTNVAAQIVAIALGAMVGFVVFPKDSAPAHTPLGIPLHRVVAITSAATLAGLLLLLPIVAFASGSYTLDLIDRFFRVGSIVIGGGHVALPLLQREVVLPGWISNDKFLEGYGAAQAIPGPLFAFAAYLGAASSQEPNGWLGAAIAVAAIFAPSFLILWAALPYWERIRRIERIRSGMQGANAAVVGILLAALYDPVWTNAVTSSIDFALICAAFIAVLSWEMPSWAVVLFVTLVTTALAHFQNAQ